MLLVADFENYLQSMPPKRSMVYRYNLVLHQPALRRSVLKIFDDHSDIMVGWTYHLLSFLLRKQLRSAFPSCDRAVPSRSCISHRPLKPQMPLTPELRSILETKTVEFRQFLIHIWGWVGVTRARLLGHPAPLSAKSKYIISTFWLGLSNALLFDLGPCLLRSDSCVPWDLRLL